MEWPTDILLHFLQALDAECDSGAQRAWHQLAFLTCKRQHSELCRLAKIMPRPILLRIEIESDAALVFKIPFMQATVVCVDVDWGDGSVDWLREKGAGFAEHTYSASGEYAVRISPRGEGSISLDHLGFLPKESDGREILTAEWWRPLRQIVSFGCGLQSLSYLFSRSLVLRVPLEHLRFPGVTDLNGMFYKSNFNEPIGDWDVSNVTNMTRMFFFAHQFSQPIGDWNVGKVTDMSEMFQDARVFNQPIGDWNVSNVRNMSFMFDGASFFNQPLNGWDVSNVTDTSYMFHRAFNFNQPIGDWNVGKVTNMTKMFLQASSFDQPIGRWDVSRVTTLSNLFAESAFNQPIGDWNVSNVTNMTNMFHETLFNQPIGCWDVSNVTNMRYMFHDDVYFNQPIGDGTLEMSLT
jgi:surface protein